MFNNFFSQNRAVYEIMSKNLVVPEATNDVTLWRIRVACRISKIIRTYARTQVCNTYYFSRATDSQKRLMSYSFCRLLYSANSSNT